MVLYKVWQQKNSQAHIMSVPFLPVNPDLSSMKNQGRQKLACYGQKEFKNLVIQILIEINRRTQPGMLINKQFQLQFKISLNFSE